ncbi:hypothetical protein JNB62_13205 [Microbacterium jejuense]|uniref:Minor tail protein n=1 Tax=Microbacterium jejuense TaxID=1263637 RepID=A0ABS7HPP3_9MICO|nr:hypothetical protein [Microbacterium jejuense]MBW9094648.1 hypothetical protein [Microbacterium jejuense]
MNDTSILNISGLLARATAQGPGQEDDTALTITAPVLEVDPAKARVRVAVRGGDVWLPAIAARYSVSSLARVQLDPTSARPVLVLGAVFPRKPAELGAVTATGSGTVTVTVAGVSATIPAPLGTYSVGQSAWVMLDDWGAPVIALGPSTTTAPGGGGGAAPGGGGTVSATATITPQWSGTYRTGYGWDSWNTTRYGGRSDIYQGSGFNSGLLIGLATYGDQLVNLGAVSIDEITMAAKKTDTNGLSAALAVQGSAHASKPGGAPSGSGETAATGTIAPGAWGGLAFTANMRNAFRTGAAKGLIAVGGAYGGFGGTGTPGSFVLQVRYTKNV